VANLGGDEKKVYEFITRRFLACCSKDAEGWETTVDVVCGDEFFYATGLSYSFALFLMTDYFKII
jgi:DNA topoisomerase III